MSLLVLDTSAVIAYARGSVDVGEPIAEVHSEGGTVLVPDVCLIEAASRVGDDMPRLLLEHPACELEPLSLKHWPALAAARTLDRLDLVAALHVAALGQGYILTGEPAAYGVLGEDLVIPI